MNTRLAHRKILEDRGYVIVFSDINNRGVNPYEDWWVHPELVDIEYVNLIKEKNKNKYEFNSVTGKSINWEDIEY